MTTLSGYVQDNVTGAPIKGARVVVGPATVLTGADGSIPSTAVLLKGPTDQVDGVVSADGYDPWHFSDVTLHAGQPVELHVKLRYNGAAAQSSDLQQAGSQLQNPAVASAPIGLPPQYVDVGITGEVDCAASLTRPILVQRMSFVDYVRNVLPNEWISGWPAASLDAGAIAVKQYAWYTVAVERKWRNRGYPFDLIDSTCDQVYKPDSAAPDTDAAIARTWSTQFLLDGKLIPLFYRSTVDNCPAVPGCMGQIESRDHAYAGENAPQILSYFYDPRQHEPSAGVLPSRASLPLAR